jgi:ABC-type polar amino acid transport system ATPase subunit
VSQLSKAFDSKQVLRDVSLSVEVGSAIAIVGRSGGGKSTLLRCINLLELPTCGRIEIGGDVIFHDGVKVRGGQLAHLRQRVGMLFQSFNVFPHLTAVENVALPLIRVARIDEREALRRGFALLDRVGLLEKARSLPGTLSGGQQQRVAIARALALRPWALLCDEPTSALDPESTREVLDVLRELCREGMTTIVVTHELGFAEEVADQIVFMDGGSIVEAGQPQEILYKPRERRTQEFVSRYQQQRSRGDTANSHIAGIAG